MELNGVADFTVNATERSSEVRSGNTHATQRSEMAQLSSEPPYLTLYIHTHRLCTLDFINFYKSPQISHFIQYAP